MVGEQAQDSLATKGRKVRKKDQKQSCGFVGAASCCVVCGEFCPLTTRNDAKADGRFVAKPPINQKS